MFSQEQGGTIRFKTFNVLGGASLEELSGGLPQYRNYRVAEQSHKLKPLQIATPDGIFSLDMEHSNHEIEKNEAVRIQIRLAIQNHFAAALQKDFNDNMHYDKNEVTAEILISTLKKPTTIYRMLSVIKSNVVSYTSKQYQSRLSLTG